ncbi:putative capsular associated protein [Aspergillus novofumigatus IBT 16806]|uniref:Putative capsule associated protein n=1 Tax=Aspergillus novofumigatus (strain IBT 16806) TaxID=1392255 RepID=A0A2I1CHD6_ASPN1|nr:putative capsule associated protein [Aspergillus novofumigatus IBT 16806]PKX97010.1 putative capsule associated protein [Aspergillus novofumigatus IBT 16806]
MVTLSPLRVRSAVLIFLGVSFTLGFWLFGGRSHEPVGFNIPYNHADSPSPSGDHPIDQLILNADAEWRSLLGKEAKTFEAATEEYRRRRDRHPPPGFKEWFEFARSKDALIIEDFFDQIYDDLNPFWGLEPKEIRRQAQSLKPRIAVRKHKATAITDHKALWLDSWLSLVRSIQQYLPDLDMPFNPMDESRIVVPSETIAEYMGKERVSRQWMRDKSPAEFITEYTAAKDEPQSGKFEPRFLGPNDGPFWHMARVGCPPDSPSRKSLTVDPDTVLQVAMENFLPHSQNGYVRNWTQSKDICWRPEMQALHGTFIEPVSISTAHELFPLFGGSKLPVNNEILIPPAMYWAKDKRYSGGDKHGGPWESKKDSLIWRGIASGGRNRINNWTGFQRHRLLAMLNGTSVAAAERNNSHFVNFVLPNYDYYNLASGHAGQLHEFVEDHVDAGFIHLVCFPCVPDQPCEYDLTDPHCAYTEPYFALVPAMPMDKQYDYKYLPDIDGNSFSGRYRGFLLSTSLPIKATIYDEWHDSRLIPWAHFVPMDSTFLDIYGIMEYFIGYGGPGHDSAARKIALNGKEWAEKVLRREDMQIYMYRLLLEYARICDDRRDNLGYTEDILWVDRE